MSQHLQERLRYAQEQFEIGNYGRVERVAEELINNEDQSFLKEGLVLKGSAFYLQNQLQDAYQYFTQAIDRFPDAPMAYLYRFEILIAAQEFEKAKADALTLISLDAENVEYLDKVIQANEHLGDFEAVIEGCDKVLALHPEEPSFLSTRGTAHMALKQFEAGIQDFDLLLKNPELREMDRAYIYNNLGFAHLQNESYSDARTALSRSLDLNPDNMLAMNNLGSVMYELGDMKEAMRWLNKSLDLAPEQSYAYKNRAKIHIKNGDLEEARADLMQAKDLNYDEQYGNEVNELLAQIDAA